ncbi:MAG TPA: tripartite tricarboxylate transporter substrate-binding protein [Egibacteraceae bacterium]
MKKLWVLLAVLLLAVTACSGGEQATDGDDAAAEDDASPASAEDEDVAAFYADNGVRVIGGHDAGGGFDFYMRAVARGMERVCDVSTTVQNLPGAGGLIGDNELFSSEPDGLTVGLINYPGHVFAQLTDVPEVEYDFAEWEFLGRVASDTPMVIVKEGGEFDSLDDLVNAGRPIRYGIEGAGSDAYYGAALAAETFGYDHELITGYGGSNEIITAITRGEVDATFLSVGSSIQSIRNGEIRPLVVFGEEAPEELSDTPTAVDSVESPEDQETVRAFGNIYQLERTFVAPPGTPEARVAWLRDCMMQVFEDEEFVAEVEAADRVVVPLSGEEVAAASAEVEAQADQLRELLSSVDQ